MGYLMSYSNPEIIREQLIALRKLGLDDEASPVIMKRDAALFLLWDIKQEYKFAFNQLDESQIAGLSYELQTVALNSFRSKLIATGLEGLDLISYQRAFIELPEMTGLLNGEEPLRDGFMAFSWDPDREGDGYWAELQNLFIAESSERVDLAGRRHVQVAPRIWSGLSDEARARVAGVILYRALRVAGRSESLIESATFGRTQCMHEMLSTAIVPNDGLRFQQPASEGMWIQGSLYQDSEEFRFEAQFSLTDSGFIVSARPLA